MALVNENYLNAFNTNYFEEVEKRVNAFKVLNPITKLLRLDCSEAPSLLPKEMLDAMHKAIDDVASINSLRTFPPVQGFDFLIEKILKDYRTIGVSLDKESVFVNDGSISDISNITHILGRDNLIAVADPVYSLFENISIISGRAGMKNKEAKWSNIVYLRCNPDTGFVPQIPDEKVDIIYLSNPNNPTGVVLTKEDLKDWVDYAIQNESIIIYDTMHYTFINEDNVPRSIYEVKGAKKVAIEIKSFSKTIGYSSLACGFTVVPTELSGFSLDGESASVHNLWKTRINNFSNGVPYIAQKGAEAILTRKGKIEFADFTNNYLINASLIREELLSLGWEVYGGKNSPYVWFRIPGREGSWKYFTQLLYESNVVGTPGIAFGASHDNYMRFSGISRRPDVLQALKNMK